MKLSNEQVLKHVHVYVGEDGAWLELKTSSGKSFMFQPVQEFGAGSHFRSTVAEWANEIQQCYVPQDEQPLLDRLASLLRLDLQCKAEKLSCAGCPLYGADHTCTGVDKVKEALADYEKARQG